MAPIKKEILILYTNSCTRNQYLFCKNDDFQNPDFSRLKCQLKWKKNLRSIFVKIFQVSADEGKGKKSKLAEFSTQKL